VSWSGVVAIACLLWSGADGLRIAARGVRGVNAK